MREMCPAGAHSLHKSFFPALCLSLSTVNMDVGFRHWMEVLVGAGKTVCGFIPDHMMKQAMET